MLAIIIASIGIVLSFISIVYTFFQSKYRVDLSKYQSAIDRDQNRIYFQIINTSSRPLIIENIFLLKEGVPIKEIDFDINEFDRRLFYQTHSSIEFFNSSIDSTIPIERTLLAPFERMDVNIFVNDFPTEIDVLSNKSIGIISKHKSFVVFNNH